MSQIIKVLEGLVKLGDDGEEEGTVFSEAYDEEGNSVCCPSCGDEMYFKDGTNIFVCLSCGYEMDRQEYFDYIGAEPPGEECKTCDSLYPGCIWCTYGYVKDEDEF